MAPSCPASWTYPLEIKKLTPPNGLIWQFPVGASSSRADFLFRVSFQTGGHTMSHISPLGQHDSHTRLRPCVSRTQCRGF